MFSEPSPRILRRFQGVVERRRFYPVDIVEFRKDYVFANVGRVALIFEQT